MITFKEYLREESVSATRTKGVDMNAFKDWCDKHASKYLKGRKFLFRGGSGTGNSVFMLGDSNFGKPRKSANTSNNYTLWLDNHPAFEGWPKRSRSFIATTSYHTADGFGEPRFIIPADNASIGIVGEDDLWHVDIGYGIQFEDLSYMINDIIEIMGLKYTETFDGIKQNLEKITIDSIEKKLDGRNDFVANTFLKAIKGTGTDNLFDCLSKLITPKLFDRSNGANISNRKVDGEVWIQGECAFLPLDGKSVSYSQRKEIVRWLEERGYRKFVDTLQMHWEHKYDPDEEN